MSLRYPARPIPATEGLFAAAHRFHDAFPCTSRHRDGQTPYSMIAMSIERLLHAVPFGADHPMNANNESEGTRSLRLPNVVLIVAGILLLANAVVQFSSGEQRWGVKSLVVAVGAFYLAWHRRRGR